MENFRLNSWRAKRAKNFETRKYQKKNTEHHRGAPPPPSLAQTGIRQVLQVLNKKRTAVVGRYNNRKNNDQAHGVAER